MLDHPPPVHRKTLDLLEMYCFQFSQLTQQVNNLGGKALRFTLREGDLTTREGRYQVYHLLRSYQVRHIWLAPDCNPWCSWSKFNMMRSVTACNNILTKRRNHKCHLMLCSVLMFHQIFEGTHMHCHLEQPQKSDMLWHSKLEPLIQHTLGCDFDMCSLGLKHPSLPQFLRRRTHVRTTSDTLHKELAAQQCPKDHEHFVISGKVPTSAGNVSTSSFSAHYSSQFAELIARYMLTTGKRENRFLASVPSLEANSHVAISQSDVPVSCSALLDAFEGPCGWIGDVHESEAIFATIQEQAAKCRKIIGKTTPRPRLPQSEKRTSSESADTEPIPKTLKTDHGDPPKYQAEETISVKDLVKQVAKTLPRVGAKECLDERILRGLQKLFPEVTVKKIIGCRGTECERDPIRFDPKKQLPWRRSFFIHRKEGICPRVGKIGAS